MEPMATPILLVTPALLVILVLTVLVKYQMSLTLQILEPMKVGSPMIQFMTLLLERTRQTRDCKITQVLKLELPMGQIQKLMVAMITLD